MTNQEAIDILNKWRDDTEIMWCVSEDIGGIVIGMAIVALQHMDKEPCQYCYSYAKLRPENNYCPYCGRKLEDLK